MDETVRKEMDAAAHAISSLRAPAMPGEYDLHALLRCALGAAGLEFAHEHKLAPRCRIDFLVGSVGIEVKKGRPERRTLLAQLTRYLSSAELGGLIVVCQRQVELPKYILNKPVECVSLNRLWGVALP